MGTERPLTGVPRVDAGGDMTVGHCDVDGLDAAQQKTSIHKLSEVIF